MRVDPQQLKAFLLDEKLATPAQLEEAEKKSIQSGKKLGEVLVEEKIIGEEDLIKLQAYILGVPYVNLEKEKIDPRVLQIIPEPIARTHNIVAYKKAGQTLEVAMLDPEDLQTIEFIKKTANLKIRPRLASPASIQTILKQYQKSLEVEFGEIIKKETPALTAYAEEERAILAEEGEDLKKIAEDLPIIKIVDTLIKHAVLQKASDIHIEPSEKEVMVRYRIDGILRPAMTLPFQVKAGIIARIKVLSNLKLDEHRLPQDGRFKIDLEGQRISFRVSVLPVYDGEKIVMRLLPESASKFSLEQLGFFGEGLELIKRSIKKPTGMILVTGPTGSGKTTTLYTVLEMLNTSEVNISTVEDPIEYRIEGINQTQVRPHIGLTFANGLRSLLRQDPNIIMVGEIRDEETASLAVNASLTGHLVLSTLHTNSAAGALPRLLDMKVEPFLIASTVNIITAQRLVRTLCPEKEAYVLSKSELDNLAKEFDMNAILKILKIQKIVPADGEWQDVKFYRPKRAAECADGYKGRIGIHEVMNVSEAIKALIVKGATSGEIEKKAKEEGMITMLDDGFIKAAQGITSLEEVLRVTRE